MPSQRQPRHGSARPKNWPASVHYLTSPSYSEKLTHAQLAAIRTRPSSSSLTSIVEIRIGPSPAVRIEPITNSAHPACGQSGLFAARDLRPGEFVVPYLGVIHPGGLDDPTVPEGSHADSDYDIWLDRDAGIAVNAEVWGNEARFVNDYRGVPAVQRANVEFREVWDEKRGELTMAIYVLPASKRAAGKARMVGVGKGQELLVSYGKGFWESRRRKGEPGCGTENYD